MTTALTVRRFLPYAIPILLIAVVVLVAHSLLFRINAPAISIGITFDLLITVPLVHFLMVRRNGQSILFVLPFFVMGLLLATALIPKEHQFVPQLAKVWLLPLIEMGAMVFVVRKVWAAIKANSVDAQQHEDTFDQIKKVCNSIVPRPLSVLFASELAVVYYAFFYWRQSTLRKNEFAYHGKSGTIVILTAILFLALVEGFVTHLLLVRWSVMAAWILSGLTIYAAVQLLGFMKSIMARPIVITGDRLILRYGILSDASIDIREIESVEISSKDIPVLEGYRALSLFAKLEGHNIILRLNKEATLTGIYGINRTCKIVYFSVDQPKEFKTQLDSALVSFK